MQCLIVFVITFLVHQTPTLAYKAAVVEYYATSSDTPKNTIRKNLNEYRSYADTARTQGADIIIFPEYGLTTIVNDPASYAIEIDTTNDIITEISSLAKEHNLYTVVNLLEKAKNEATFYSTNLVFDKDGKIIAKYRKINLYNEPSLTKGANDQNASFTTDFGVTFGIFSGDDIIFENPSRTVLRDSRVTDVIYTSAWVSTMPFYSSLGVQYGYWMATGVNLLASNYGQPKSSHGGSGIYSAEDRILENYIADTPSTKLIVQEVSKMTNKPDKTRCLSINPFALPGDLARNNVSNYATKRSFSASDYKFQSIDINQKNTTTKICHGEFCCTFDIVVDLSQTSSNIYKVMAFDGVVDADNAHIRVCTLLACDNDSNDSCGNRVNTTAKFTRLAVKGNLKKDDGDFYSPITLNNYLLPFAQTSYCDTGNGTGSTYVQLVTTKAQQNVLVFGLFSRTPTSLSSRASVHVSCLFLMVVFSMVKWIVV